MSKRSVYLSAHDPELAAGVAALLRTAGVDVVSTWHDETGPKADVSDSAF